MEVLDFKKELENNNGLSLDEDFILFNNYELYDLRTDKSHYFKTFDDVLNFQIKDKTIKEIVEEKENFDDELNGGRGAESKKGAKLFTGGSKKGKKKLTGFSKSNGNSFPAYLNARGNQRFKSQEMTTKEFAKMTEKEFREYSAVLDELGYAQKYNKGDSGSTAFLSYKNGLLIHNHPVYDKKGRVVAWNAFSGQDLRAIAKNGETNGIVAVANGNKSVYKFTKTKRFKANEFIKGLNKARMNSANYDKEVDSWLRRNQKTYGYKYSRRKY